ncbi:hypothetical protein VM1G_07539 [Cytospora mali]|uniref:Uncharacterized protein n=1 Tax=Cytospora mali TaxID=578113 RepID=A0A194W756_CYTMA|nr:hypothetical protein VM1G_07539 [Valsa mali]
MSAKRSSKFDDRGDNKRPALGSSLVPDEPERQVDDVEEIIRPRFWSGYAGTGRGRSVKARDTIKDLKAAYSDIINLEGQLTFNQQRELFPYIFWPPLPKWCLVPFDMQACSKSIRTDEGVVNPLVYGLGAKSIDQVWKHAVLGVFQPQRRIYQMFDHVLIAIHFPWADDGSPDDVPMWGLVHYQKGADTAYVHVMTQWQEWVFNNAFDNRRWAGELIETITGEKGIDDDLLLGDRPSINIQWVSNLNGPDWSSLGWRDQNMENISDMSFLYIIHAATQLAVHNAHDTSILEFGADEAYEALAQALLGVSTALEHGEEGNIQSVRDGIIEDVRRDSGESVAEYRDALERMLTVVAAEYENRILERGLSESDKK